MNPDNDEYESDIPPDDYVMAVLRSLMQDYQRISRMFNKDPKHSKAYRDAAELVK